MKNSNTANKRIEGLHSEHWAMRESDHNTKFSWHQPPFASCCWAHVKVMHKPCSYCNYLFTRRHVAKPSCLMDQRYLSSIYRFMKRAMDINSQPTAKGQKLSKQPKCWNQTPVPAMPKEGNSTPAMTSQHITQTFLYGSLSHYLLDVGG